MISEEILNRMANEGLLMIYLEQELATELLQARQRIRKLEEALQAERDNGDRLAGVVKAYSGITVTDRAYPNDETSFQFAYEALHQHEQLRK